MAGLPLFYLIFQGTNDWFLLIVLAQTLVIAVEQFVVVVVEVHAVALAEVPHLTLRALALASPRAVAKGFEAVLPHIPNVVLIDISLDRKSVV